MGKYKLAWVIVVPGHFSDGGKSYFKYLRNFYYNFDLSYHCQQIKFLLLLAFK